MNLQDEVIKNCILNKDIKLRNQIATELLPFINNKVTFFCKVKHCKRLQEDLFGDCSEKLLYLIFDFNINSVSDKYVNRTLNKLFFSFINYRISYFLIDRIRNIDHAQMYTSKVRIRKFKNAFYKEHGFYPSDEEIINKLNIKQLKLVYTSQDRIVTSLHENEQITYRSYHNEGFTNIDFKDLFTHLLKGYSARTKDILIDKFVNNLALNEICSKYNITIKLYYSLVEQFKEKAKIILEDTICH